MFNSRIVSRIVARPFIIIGIFVAAAVLCGCMCAAAAISGAFNNQNASTIDVMPIGAVTVPVL